jgi:DNA-binding beta-propeller fold protein YncE
VAADGKILQRWGTRGVEPGQFSLIRSIVVAPDEQSVYVVDEGNRRIDQFKLTGELIKTWGNDELGVQTPIGLALDSTGTFYLLDGTAQQVVRRAADGSVQKWPWPNRVEGVNTIAVDAARGRLYVGGTGTKLYVFDGRGVLLGTDDFNDSGILVAVGPTGHVYASTGWHAIYVSDPTD